MLKNSAALCTTSAGGNLSAIHVPVTTAIKRTTNIQKDFGKSLVAPTLHGKRTQFNLWCLLFEGSGSSK